MADAAEAKKKSSPVGKIVLLVILVAVAGYGGWKFQDSKTVERLNRFGESLPGDETAVLGAIKKNPVDTAALERLHAAFADIVDKNGGIFGPSFTVRSELRHAAGERKLAAAAFAPTCSLLLGKVDQARAEVKRYHTIESELPGVAGNFNDARMVGQLEKLLGELKKPGANQKALVKGFRAGLAAAR